MEDREAVPVSQPRDNPTRSYWQLDPDAIADLRSTDSLPGEADIVIVGSGITGAAVAFNLLRNASHNIIMLEARQACSGATGRNGGHTKAASYLTFPHNKTKYGTEMATKIVRLELANIRAMHKFAREQGIECDSNHCSTMDVVYDAQHWALSKRAITALQDAMPGDDASVYTFHTPEEVRDKFFCGKGGDEGVSGGISYEAGSLNAYKFTIGLLKLCLDKGLNIQTNTPVTNVCKRPGGGYRVETTRGTINAKKVVMATNGYTAHLLKRFQGIIIPKRGHVTAQRPGLNMPTDGLPITYTFYYSSGYDYMISRPKGSKNEGDIIIGGRVGSAASEGVNEFGNTDDTAEDKDIMRALSCTLPRYFGDNWGDDHPDGRIRTQWTGIMGSSHDGLPFVGEMPGEKDLWVCASFQGHGMVLCWMCAMGLVEIMEGRDSEALNSWFPAVFRISESRFGQMLNSRAHAHRSRKEMLSE
ncbi:FAD dependent oxidoreductase [Xylaria nigripes]|nr:FAD dependent oxidoreductase [Xylaria nigripes]